MVLGQATSGDPRGLPLIHYCLFEHPAFISFVWLILVVLKPGPHDLLFNELKIFSGSMRSSLVSYLKILDPAPPQKKSVVKESAFIYRQTSLSFPYVHVKV